MGALVARHRLQAAIGKIVEAVLLPLLGALLLEQNDEWAGQRSRYITLESVVPIADDPLVSLPAMVR